MKIDNWNLVSKIVEAAGNKGAAHEKLKKYRYGSANWREVEKEFEEAALELVKLERIFHENFPLVFVDISEKLE